MNRNPLPASARVLATALGVALALSSTVGAAGALAGEVPARQDVTRQAPARQESMRCAADLARPGRPPAWADAGSARELRALHQAAAIFARHGLEEACQAIAGGIRELQAASAGREQDEASQARYRDRLSAAPALDALPVGRRAGELIGRRVVTPDGEALGDVDDVMLGPDGRTRYLLIGSGGFLGVGEQYTPVESRSLRVVDDDTLALPVDAKDFEAAPRVGLERIDTAAEQWSREVQAWWSRNVHDQEALAR